jgi:hypothetical protein
MMKFRNLRKVGSNYWNSQTSMNENNKLNVYLTIKVLGQSISGMHHSQEEKNLNYRTPLANFGIVCASLTQINKPPEFISRNLSFGIRTHN